MGIEKWYKFLEWAGVILLSMCMIAGFISILLLIVSLFVLTIGLFF